jgi:N-acetylneuraminic acid mutarotase
MRSITVLSAWAAIGLLACASEDGPTEPASSGAMAPAGPALAGAVNLWRPRTPHQFGDLIGVSVGVLANPAGQSVVYGFGGCDVAQGDFGHCTVQQIAAYNAVTDSWTFDHSFLVSVWSSNGVGAIGGKLYSSGGYNVQEAGDKVESRRVWAYDPVARQATQRADMPRFTAEGVTGVFGDKLYVLPGNCDSNFRPRPGYCKQEPIRRLYRYDPAQDKWAARRSAPHYHRSGAGGVIGGKFYVVGGFHGSTPVAALDVYDPATDTWTTKAPIPAAGQAIGTALEGKLYVIAGSKAYVYNPGTNKWTSIAAPTHGTLWRGSGRDQWQTQASRGGQR